MSVLEIKPYKEVVNGETCRSDFFAFVDGKPRPDINCRDCIHFVDDETNCLKAQEVGADDKIYPFCGQICGYFDLKDGSLKVEAVRE